MYMEVLRPKFTEKILSKNQSATDILKGIRTAITESIPAAQQITKKFEAPTDKEVCDNVWRYLKNRLTYYREPRKLQTTKPIQRILFDKFGDCKHYTTFAAAQLMTMGIPVSVKLISQDKADKDPTHIYCVAKVDGHDYVVDPVMESPGQEAIHYYQCTINGKKMLKYMNGTNSHLGKNKLKGKLQQAIKHATPKQLQEAQHKVAAAAKNAEQKIMAAQKQHNERVKKDFQRVRDQEKRALQKVGKTIKKEVNHFAHINKEVAKKAFLLLVSKNQMLMAHRLRDFNKNHPNELRMWWKNIGTWDELVKAVNKGNRTGARFSGDDGGAGGASGSSGSSGSGSYQQYEEGAKQSVGLIQQILALFQKHKQKKMAGDDEQVDKMLTDVQNDPTIPKIDASGNPATQEQVDASAMTPEQIAAARLRFNKSGADPVASNTPVVVDSDPNPNTNQIPFNKSGADQYNTDADGFNKSGADKPADGAAANPDAEPEPEKKSAMPWVIGGALALKLLGAFS